MLRPALLALTLLLLAPAGLHLSTGDSSPALANVTDLPTPEPASGLLDWILRVLSPTLPLPPPRMG
jgi:hypothetical protein